MRSIPTLAALGITILLAGCGDSTAPSPYSGTYVLRTIDGEGEPLITVDHTFSSGERIVFTTLYDTVSFTSTGARRSLAHQSNRYASNGDPISQNGASAVYNGTVERLDDGVAITWNAPGGPTQQTFEYRDRALHWETLVGLYCSEGCPPPRVAEFTYARP